MLPCGVRAAWVGGELLTPAWCSSGPCPGVAHPTLTRFQRVLDGTGRRIVSANNTDKTVFIGFDVHNAPSIGSADGDRPQKNFFNLPCTGLSGRVDGTCKTSNGNKALRKRTKTRKAAQQGDHVLTGVRAALRRSRSSATRVHTRDIPLR